ncbi:MAG: carboxypeptidase regulatory-like domain-containing protein [Theionarchaea archaeon]|nr:carboxypeptidase regulatory-like domain-containing protein [Theionarchaea archaeon]MBU7000159.1 carboxypeptidase regulatory-like domain-containing protein [Theionarchaea archaeon]MBU7020876.1 carboxypeptidase regulatory-like domain-containing protein [Theionarchaea archaeon]MBU7034964.1 carboxypeptidase regulatory-like domain-containing protein [Theionarchaea archaeon]MBU7039182.1 carboxypeptidase regulatory-like domain-containing protein [Theionarchaea archaeon]
MKKPVIIVLFLVFAASVVPLYSQAFAFSDEPFTITIEVDKGCGGKYFVGDMLTVTWVVSHPCEIDFWEEEPDGVRRKLSSSIIASAGTASRGWTLKDYGYGRRVIHAEAVSPFGMGNASCEYYVLKKAADIRVEVTDQDGMPISAVDVLMDDTYIAATDASGSVVIPEVEFGEHTITAKYDNEEQSTRVRIASTQTQYVDFVFTVEKQGSIKIQVVTQNGDPVADVDIYIDGFKEGHTDPDGVFTVIVPAGAHTVEAKWQNQSDEQHVTVFNNQMSFADLVITVPVEAVLGIRVEDDAGTPLSDANVYVDNVFAGRTDTQGVVQYKTVPGAHTLRAEKQGYITSSSNITAGEGQTDAVLVLDQEGNAALSTILVLVGVGYMLMRKRA